MHVAGNQLPERYTWRSLSRDFEDLKHFKDLKDCSSTSDLSFVSLGFLKVLQLMSGLKGDMDATARGASVVSSLGVTADHTDLEASKRPNHSKPFEMMICLQLISAKPTVLVANLLGYITMLVSILEKLEWT